MMTEQNEAQLQTMPRRATGPVGTAGRVLVGFGLLYIALADVPFKWGWRGMRPCWGCWSFRL